MTNHDLTPKPGWMVQCLVVLAIVLPLAAGVGALLGLYGQRLGLSGGHRALVIAAVSIVSVRLATMVIARRWGAGGRG